MLNQSQRDRFSVVLVSPRNPLNIGAVARAMANFGFSHLTVVAPYEPNWQEAKSAVGSSEILQHAKTVATLADAVQDCTLILGTGTLTHRKPEQPVIPLDTLGPVLTRELEKTSHIALVFGPEKHGLTREDLSWCHSLVEIPTHPVQPSMNLGQAAAVSLYEIATRAGIPEARYEVTDSTRAPSLDLQQTPLSSGKLDILAHLIDEVMVAAEYSPKNMRKASRHDLRLMLRRLHVSAADHRRILGIFRRILWRLKRSPS